jgi:hypothetical protein
MIPLLLGVLLAYSFVVIDGFVLKTKEKCVSCLMMSSNTEKVKFSIEEVTNSGIPKVATFLAQYMYSADVPVGQRKELGRLQEADLFERYGEKLGKRRLPSALLALQEGQELVG